MTPRLSRIGTAIAACAVAGTFALGAVATAANANNNPPGSQTQTTGAIGTTPKVVPRPDLEVSKMQQVNGKPFVVVSNYGDGASGPFRVMILALAQSKNVNIAGLKAHSMQVVDLSFLGCGQLATIAADPDHKTNDVNDANNWVSIQAPCKIDDGPALNPVDE